jgi:hypothetical protein
LKKIIVFILVLLFSANSRACDICGCGLGNYYIGIVPQFNNSFFGVRYHYRQFHTQIKSDETQFSNDYFQTIELWGGVNLGKKLQVLFFLPYNFNKQVSDDGTKKMNGIGDIATMVNYSLLENSSMNKKNQLVYQQLLVGAGIKLATGQSEIDPAASDIIALANSQLGTGSTDFLLNAAYTLRINKAGFTTNLNYKLNTANKENYHFGNRFSSNTFFFYSIKSGKITLTPNAGILYEHAAANKLNKVIVDETGGYLASGAAGLEVSFRKTTIGFNIQAPVTQDFASGQTTSKFRTMAHISFGF